MARALMGVGVFMDQTDLAGICEGIVDVNDAAAAIRNGQVSGITATGDDFFIGVVAGNTSGVMVLSEAALKNTVETMDNEEFAQAILGGIEDSVRGLQNMGTLTRIQADAVMWRIVAHVRDVEVQAVLAAIDG